jgi:MFS family permease
MTFTNVIGMATLVFGVSYGTQEGYGIGFSTSDMLWVTLVANITAVLVIPVFGALSDRLGRRPFMVVGGIGGGLSSGLYLWAVQQKNLVLVFVLVILVQGIFFQMWNATFATFFQEQFPMRIRVTGFAVSQNIGLMLASFFPSIFAAIAPPGSTNVPLVIGATTFGITLVAAIATLLRPSTRGKTLADLEAPPARIAVVQPAAGLNARVVNDGADRGSRSAHPPGGRAQGSSVRRVGDETPSRSQAHAAGWRWQRKED